jgi:hypothetical protein
VRPSYIYLTTESLVSAKVAASGKYRRPNACLLRAQEKPRHDAADDPDQPPTGGNSDHRRADLRDQAAEVSLKLGQLAWSGGPDDPPPIEIGVGAVACATSAGVANRNGELQAARMAAATPADVAGAC